jgi:hypothetical protein
MEMSDVVFKQSVVDTLIQSIETNISKYTDRSESWVDDHFGDRSLYAVTKLPELPDNLLLLPKDGDDFDLENSQRLYDALSGMTSTQAADPRLWTYLTHVKFWKYMQARWPVKPKDDSAKQIGPIRSRYFLIGDKARGLTRNGISRLWWAGRTCHDDSNSDRFRYARALFATQDVYASMMERAFSKNIRIIHPVLSVLTRRLEAGTPFVDREKVRDLSKYLVLLGGAIVLDMLPGLSIEDIVSSHIAELENQPAATVAPQS